MGICDKFDAICKNQFLYYVVVNNAEVHAFYFKENTNAIFISYLLEVNKVTNMIYSIVFLRSLFPYPSFDVKIFTKLLMD